MDRVGIAFACSLALLLLVEGGCSADRKANRDYDRTCGSGETRYGKYCVPAKDEKDAGGERDANTPDDKDSGPRSDAGDDAGKTDAGTDAGMPQSCEQVGKKEVCYPYDGDPLTQLQDPCSAGIWECLSTHVWGECVGVQIPEAEVCDGLDNDCDGATDDGVLPLPCKIEDGSVSGACAENGIGVCSGGDVLCLQIVKPKPETCNEVDDDCDGETDEGLDVQCYGGSSGCTWNATTKSYECVPGSTCAAGTLRCSNGEMQTACTDDVRPSAEAGTNVGETPFDEDCDGMIDETFDCQNGATYPCYTGNPPITRNTAPCHGGMSLCTNGAFGACMNQQTPVAESCANEGVDNDCDGTEDDIPTRDTSCSDESTNMGLCKQNALRQCVAGSEICVDGAMSAEVCNGRDEDEDCDGSVDEGFNLQTDANNCGSCGHRCGAGQTCCGGMCVNIQTSNAHCGGCNAPCGTLTCCAGGCVNTRSDVRNCGMCGKQCLLGGLLGCSNGGCL